MLYTDDERVLLESDVGLRVYARLRAYCTTVDALRRMAKNVGMRNYSKLRKDELISRLAHHLARELNFRVSPDMPYLEVARIMRAFDAHMDAKFYE